MPWLQTWDYRNTCGDTKCFYRSLPVNDCPVFSHTRHFFGSPRVGPLGRSLVLGAHSAPTAHSSQVSSRFKLSRRATIHTIHCPRHRCFWVARDVPRRRCHVSSVPYRFHVYDCMFGTVPVPGFFLPALNATFNTSLNIVGLVSQRVSV